MSMLADLLDAKRKLSAMPPVARKIYVVDREEMYTTFLGACKDEPPVGMLSAFIGIPVFVLKSSEYTLDMPFYCATPGIWVEMSDGGVLLFE